MVHSRSTVLASNDHPAKGILDAMYLSNFFCRSKTSGMVTKKLTRLYCERWQSYINCHLFDIYIALRQISGHYMLILDISHVH